MLQYIKNIIRPVRVAVRIWIVTSMVFSTGWLLYSIFFSAEMDMWWLGILAGVGAAIVSLPVLLVLTIALIRIEKLPRQRTDKIGWLVFIAFVCTLPYGLFGGLVWGNIYNRNNDWVNYVQYALGATGILFACSIVSMLLNSDTNMERPL